MRFYLLIASLAALSCPPLLGAQSTPADSAQPLPSVTLPPDLDRVLRDYERAWLSRDAAGLASLFSIDGFVLQGGRPPVRGRAAIERAYAGSGGNTLQLRALAFAATDNVGYIIGAYGYAGTPGDLGKFTLTLTRGANRRWMIFSDMDNSSVPDRRPGG